MSLRPRLSPGSNLPDGACIAPVLRARRFARSPQVAISHQRREPFLVRSTNSQWQSWGGHCFRRSSSEPRSRSSAAQATGPMMRSLPVNETRTGCTVQGGAGKALGGHVADRGERAGRWIGGVRDCGPRRVDSAAKTVKRLQEGCRPRWPGPTSPRPQGRQQPPTPQIVDCRQMVHLARRAAKAQGIGEIEGEVAGDTVREVGVVHENKCSNPAGPLADVATIFFSAAPAGR